MTAFNQAPQSPRFKLSSALLPPAPSTDYLSLALHSLSQSPNLTHLSLRDDIILSSCFFWPQESIHPAPSWPLLQYLSVWLNIATPEDDWLCVLDPEDSDDDDHDEDVDPLTLSDYLELAGLELAGIIGHVEGIVEENETTSTHSSDSEIPQTFNHRLQSHLDGSKPKRYFCKIFDAERLNTNADSHGACPETYPSIWLRRKYQPTNCQAQ